MSDSPTWIQEMLAHLKTIQGLPAEPKGLSFFSMEVKCLDDLAPDVCKSRRGRVR